MIGKSVFVRPTNSMKFGGRWGQVTDIEHGNLMPIKVLFETDIIPYSFSKFELMTEQEYFSWFEVGEKAYDKSSGATGVVSDLKFPYAYLGSDEIEVHFKELLPITECIDCFEGMIGTFVEICDRCHSYSFDEGGENDGKN